MLKIENPIVKAMGFFVVGFVSEYFMQIITSNQAFLSKILTAFPPNPTALINILFIFFS